ncbi:MAG: transglutaminase-like domain-containing protein [Defluviitaleaceae bacterium]|nr:transglutaminase-like domain-containing protein [Defluviitaleaceae bacterium]
MAAITTIPETERLINPEVTEQATKRERKPEDYIMYLVLGGIYAFAVNLSILNTTIVQVPLWSLALLGFAMLVVFGIIFHNKFTMLATLAFVAFMAFFMFMLREQLEDLWAFADELILFARGFITFQQEFVWPTVVIICLLTALFIAISLYINFNFYLMAAFGAAIFIIGWLMDYAQSWLGFLLYLFCFCVLLIYKLQNRQTDGTKAALVSAPVCALIVWVVSIVPTPTASLDNATLNRLLYDPWDVIGEAFFMAFNPKYFSFQTTGFAGQGGRLGGPVSPNSRPVMAVNAERRVYLSGATHNTYTGDGWISVNNEFVPIDSRVHPSYMEFMETASALLWHTSRLELTAENRHIQLVSHLPINNVDIFVGNNRTGSLFRPMRERGIYFDNPALHDMLLINPSGDRRLDQLIPRDSAYRYNFLDLDYRDGIIQDILRQSRRGIYRDMLATSHWGTIPIYLDDDDNTEIGYATLEVFNGILELHVYIEGRRISSRQVTIPPFEDNYQFLTNFDNLIMGHSGMADGEVQFFDQVVSEGATTLTSLMAMASRWQLLADYADFVYSNYTQLPDDLPQRVIDLAHEITRNEPTDYDKALALQEFLIQFPYTLSPSNPPRDQDFVDYFLFDGQEGYCVYYASAMVVMARAIGLPARYSEGFLLPAQRDPETGLFTVTNRNAHAWAEVYFEGFGWLIIETTAPYVFAMYERPFMAASDIFASGFASWEYEEYLRQMGLWDMIAPGGWELDMDIEFTGQFAVMAPQGGQQQELNLLLIGIIAAAAVPSLIFLYFVVWHILLWLRRRNLGKLDFSQQAIQYYREILKITKYWRYPILNEETPYTYGQRLRYRFSFVNDTVFIRDLNEIYYRAKYGGKPFTQEDATFMKNCYYELTDYAKYVKGRHKYFYLRYFKGIISY